MAGDKGNPGGDDRRTVSASQGYEVSYFAKKHGLTAKEARALIARVGNDRKKLNEAAAQTSPTSEKPAATPRAKPAPKPRQAAATAPKPARQASAKRPAPRTRGGRATTSTTTTAAARRRRAGPNIAAVSKLVADRLPPAPQPVRAVVNRVKAAPRPNKLTIAATALVGVAAGLLLGRRKWREALLSLARGPETPSTYRSPEPQASFRVDADRPRQD